MNRPKSIIRPALPLPTGRPRTAAFTLIELSIVLVVIGLIVGGVLVGQDMIRAAGVRATISQIEKYQTAVATFYGKYQALPGDMNAATATQFGFASRGQYAGEGDGNGIIRGIFGDCSSCSLGAGESAGETAVFWADLSQAGLVEGNFSAASSTTLPGTITGSGIANYLPAAKLGSGNYIYVFSTGDGGGLFVQTSGVNYFGISAAVSFNAPCGGCMISNPGLTSWQAWAIDSKIDDGLPAMGRVTVNYDSLPTAGDSGITFPNDSPWQGSQSTTCFNWPNGAPPSGFTYNQNNVVNCALSFQFQTGD